LVDAGGGRRRRRHRRWGLPGGQPFGQLSDALAVALPFIAALLFLIAWAALSIADWTYPPEKHYREAQHAAASQALAYILAGRRARGQRPPAAKDHQTAC
jgi:hypothetical protein